MAQEPGAAARSSDELVLAFDISLGVTRPLHATDEPIARGRPRVYRRSVPSADYPLRYARMPRETRVQPTRDVGVTRCRRSPRLDRWAMTSASRLVERVLRDLEGVAAEPLTGCILGERAESPTLIGSWVESMSLVRTAARRLRSEHFRSSAVPQPQGIGDLLLAVPRDLRPGFGGEVLPAAVARRRRSPPRLGVDPLAPSCTTAPTRSREYPSLEVAPLRWMASSS